nr:helix-turn-helix transcriptional regulator [Amycolatopsis umgeniensis]
MTQVQVAERLDEPQSFVSKCGAGERRLDMIELHHLAAALGTACRRSSNGCGQSPEGDSRASSGVSTTGAFISRRCG